MIHIGPALVVRFEPIKIKIFIIVTCHSTHASLPVKNINIVEKRGRVVRRNIV